MNTFVFEYFPINERVVYSYRKGVNPHEIAFPHAHNRAFFQTDIENFFGNIDRALVRSTIVSHKDRIPVSDLCSYIERILDFTTIGGVLPIGFPTSPLISNACLTPFDDEFENYCLSSDLVYTRYADDIFVSGKCREDLSTVEQELNKLLAYHFGGNMRLNQEKRNGSRFEFFQSISRVDRDIRRQIILEEYSRPEELIKFLSDIYSSEKEKFQSLIRTEIRGNSYFNLLRDDGTYIREDYFSSGEYFLVSLYRTIITGSARLIVVDEIDISLDAVAQVQLIEKLRELCVKYDCNVLFTTHSLAMMRTLDDNELFYMEREGMNTELRPASYSYIKSRLFGFSDLTVTFLLKIVYFTIFFRPLFAVAAKTCFSNILSSTSGADRRLWTCL